MRWAQQEIKILEENYPRFRGKDVLKLLPNRTLKAIKVKASRLQLNKQEYQILAPLNLEESQKGYLAGIIDGEGTISINTQRFPVRNRPIVVIANTSLDLLQHIQALLRGGRIRPLHNATSKWRASWRWQLCGYHNIKVLLEELFPYLLVKRKSAELVIEYCMSRLARNAKPGRNLPLTEREKEIIREVKVLNSHGRLRS